MNRSQRFAVRSRANVVRHIIHSQDSLGEPGSNFTVVVNYVVTNIERRVRGTAIVITESRVTRVVVRPQIVMPGDRSVCTRERAVAMWAFGVLAVIQAFG